MRMRIAITTIRSMCMSELCFHVRAQASQLRAFPRETRELADASAFDVVFNVQVVQLLPSSVIWSLAL